MNQRFVMIEIYEYDKTEVKLMKVATSIINFH